ncbi:unnamed protein product [Ixodes persulcatus]
MWKFLLIALVGHLVLTSARPEEDIVSALQCDDHEVYKTCASSSCAEATCDRPRIGRACTDDCRRGCFCKNRFYRNAERRCVTKLQCPEDSAAYSFVEAENRDE